MTLHRQFSLGKLSCAFPAAEWEGGALQVDPVLADIELVGGTRVLQVLSHVACRKALRAARSTSQL